MGQHRKGNRRLWVTANYRHIEVRDMDDDHLGNAIEFLLQRANHPPTDHPARPRGTYTLWRARGTPLSWVRTFARELLRRGHTRTSRKRLSLKPFVPERMLTRPPFMESQ